MNIETVVLIALISSATSLLVSLVSLFQNRPHGRKATSESKKIDTETKLASEEYYCRVANELFEKYEGLKKLHSELKAMYDLLKDESRRLQDDSIRLRAAIEYVFVEIKDVFPNVVENARRIISSE